MRASAGLLLIAAAATLGVAAPTGAEPRTDPCGELYDRVISRNHWARLELSHDIHNSGYRQAYQLTCAPSTKLTVLVDSAAGPSFLGHSSSLNGKLVGYVVDQCEDDNAPACYTQVKVRGAVNYLEGRDSVHFSVARNPKVKGYEPVPSLRITSKGAVAFIVCPAAADRYAAHIPKRCTRPGSRARVYAYDSDNYHRRLLDRGRGIDPDSMRRTGDVIRWKHDDRWKRVRLP